MRADIASGQCKAVPRRHAAGGFTLVELMITLSVAAILAAVAVPSYRSFIGSQRVRAASFDMTSVLLQARSEALKRNRAVTITATGGSWQNGWEMTTVHPTQGSLTLGRHEAFPGMTVTAPANTLVYAGNGRLSTGAASLSLSVATGSTTVARCITVNLSGIPASRNGACS
jgi:type IV fimbrial biogenesis protein FimT